MADLGRKKVRRLEPADYCLWLYFIYEFFHGGVLLGKDIFYLPQVLGNIVYCSDCVSLHLQDCICEDTAGGLDARGAVEMLGAHGSAAALLTSHGPAASKRNFLNKVTFFVNGVSIISVHKCTQLECIWFTLISNMVIHITYRGLLLLVGWHRCPPPPPSSLRRDSRWPRSPACGTDVLPVWCQALFCVYFYI